MHSPQHLYFCPCQSPYDFSQHSNINFLQLVWWAYTQQSLACWPNLLQSRLASCWFCANDGYHRHVNWISRSSIWTRATPIPLVASKRSTHIDKRWDKIYPGHFRALLSSSPTPTLRQLNQKKTNSQTSHTNQVLWERLQTSNLLQGQLHQLLENPNSQDDHKSQVFSLPNSQMVTSLHVQPTLPEHVRTISRWLEFKNQYQHQRIHPFLQTLSLQLLHQRQVSITSNWTVLWCVNGKSTLSILNRM